MGIQGRVRGEGPHSPREARTEQAGGNRYPLSLAERGPGTVARGCRFLVILRADPAQCSSWKPA